MSEHTELPELAVGYMDQGMGHGHYAIIDAETKELLDVKGPSKDRIELIVLACNSHKKLLKACERAHDALLSLHVCNQDNSFADEIRTLLKAALDKAKET